MAFGLKKIKNRKRIAGIAINFFLNVRLFLLLRILASNLVQFKVQISDLSVIDVSSVEYDVLG